MTELTWQRTSLRDILCVLAGREFDENEINQFRDILTGFFNQPTHEITVRNIAHGIRYLPLYLSFIGLSICDADFTMLLIDELLGDARNIVRNVSKEIHPLVKRREGNEEPRNQLQAISTPTICEVPGLSRAQPREF